MTQFFLNLVSNMGEQEIGTITESLQDTVSVIICKFVCSLHSIVVLSSQAHSEQRSRDIRMGSM